RGNSAHNDFADPAPALEEGSAIGQTHAHRAWHERFVSLLCHLPLRRERSRRGQLQQLLLESVHTAALGSLVAADAEIWTCDLGQRTPGGAFDGLLRPARHRPAPGLRPKPRYPMAGTFHPPTRDRSDPKPHRARS